MHYKSIFLNSKIRKPRTFNIGVILTSMINEHGLHGQVSTSGGRTYEDATHNHTKFKSVFYL